ncbi:hypothetical protein AAFC00_006100 [Neodothiora populina]|uniref:Arabinanase/levansucrase/invertase n=1 Tax=Neodothiora populina TaxID=2781224 RepID=A0ABR3P4D6_9PEZI
MLFSTSALLALLPAAGFALPTQFDAKVKTTGSTHIKFAISQDFADPSLLQDGSQWYAFASNNHKTLGNPAASGSDRLINVQVARSPDFNSWTVTGSDALPVVGAWADPNAGSQGAAVWAPSVIQNANGQFVLHYSAAVRGDTSKHCIGAATANNPAGPYTPRATPLACPLDQGGAIDSSAFKDVDGTYYVTYKVDGNSIGHGGSCGNTVAPIAPTPIMLRKLASDALTPVGGPIEMIDRSQLDGPLVEAPSLVRTSSGKYVLFFSSNCFASSNYDVTYAFADRITGPYVKRGPMLMTGTDNLYSPGGADVAADGVHVAFHAGNVGPNNANWRSMYTMSITIDDVRQVVSS